MGIFDALSVGYSGLSTAQSGINTTSHNITNVNTPGYSRQRIEQKVNYPLDTVPGTTGNGVMVEQVARSHDEFVYSRLKSASSSLSYSEFSHNTLTEISDIFTDLEDLGIANDLKEFFNSWGDLSQNPDDESAKLVVVNRMDSLATDLKDVRNQLVKTSQTLNDEFADGIENINDLASQITELNKQINKIENVPNQNANDLRDERDRLELELSKMVNISVFKGNIDINGNPTQTDAGNAYNINIAGHNIVDGVTTHPIDVGLTYDDTPFRSAYYTDHNQGKVDITDKLKGGKIGALLDLRGDGLDPVTKKATNSKIQNYIDKIDSLATTLIQKTNSLYASSAVDKISTDDLKDLKDDSILSLNENINEGNFNVIVYDNFGNMVAKREITIDQNTTLNDDTNSSSIVTQLNANVDDNGDNDGTNDFDDLFSASVVSDPNKPHVLRILPKDENAGYKIAIEDNGTNFAGYTGVNRLFEGNDAKDISVRSDILANPSSLASSKAPITGANDLANEMVNLQYEKLSFKNPDNSTTTQTLEEFYRYTTAGIATDTNNAGINKDSAELLTKTVTEQMQAVSGVDMDEELMNLMKYQSAYQASAKIITTVDQMLNTLLGIKQ